MILDPFVVVSKGKRWRFTDSLLLDSEAEKQEIGGVLQQMYLVSQTDALCEPCNDFVEPEKLIPDQVFAVHNEATGELDGVWLHAVIGYVSGPWVDVVDWVETDPGATCVLDCRVSPGLLLVPGADEAELATDAVLHFFTKRLKTAGGHRVTFRKMKWAIFKDRTDEIGDRANKLNDAAKAHPSFRHTETVDPLDPERTKVVVELS